MTDQIDVFGDEGPVSWDGVPLFCAETVAEGLFDVSAFVQLRGQLAIEQAAEDGYISARGGKWHRAIVPEPTFMRDETSACGLTFRPLNVTWNGEHPPTGPAHLCKRCRDGR